MDSKSMGHRSAFVSKVRGRDGYCCLYRRPDGDKEDTHASWPLGGSGAPSPQTPPSGPRWLRHCLLITIQNRRMVLFSYDWKGHDPLQCNEFSSQVILKALPCRQKSLNVEKCGEKFLPGGFFSGKFSEWRKSKILSFLPWKELLLRLWDGDFTS